MLSKHYDSGKFYGNTSGNGESVSEEAYISKMCVCVSVCACVQSGWGRDLNQIKVGKWINYIWTMEYLFIQF